MEEIFELERQYPARCKFFFSALFALMQGRAQGYVRDPNMQGSGWRVWRRLIDEYEPDLPTRRVSLLSGLLQAQFSAERFDEELLAWERLVANYELLTGTALPPELKCTIVFQGAPSATRAFLEYLPSEVMSNYELLRQALRTKGLRARVYDSAGAWSKTMWSGPQPMEVDALKGKGKGKKGKKGKSSSSSSLGATTMTTTLTTPKTCFLCGSPDHLARACTRSVGRPSSAAGGLSSGVRAPSGAQQQQQQPQQQQQQPPGQQAGRLSPPRPFQGKCRRCGKVGHKQATCRVRLATLEEQAVEQVTPENHMLEPYLFMLVDAEPTDDELRYVMVLSETSRA